MKISVIIPSFNRSHLLCDAIDSISKQNLSSEDYEIIVVDNNSQDDTEYLVSRCIANHKDISIRYYKEYRQGDYFARNRGAKEALGEYLVFTDDDALFDTDYLSTILRVFEMYPIIGAVGTRISIKWEGGKPAYWVTPYEYLLGAISYSANGHIVKSNGMYINNGSLAIKRDLYISVGGINPAQIGDYIIGDAEGGLCRKIHALGVPMAFTDDTTMWHRQFVGKNDTIKDIRRRVENIGITNAYTDVIVNNKFNKKSIFEPVVNMIFYILSLRKRKALRQFFQIVKIKKYNEYIYKYQFDEKLKEFIKNYTFDW